ncbi:MAG: YhcH/YjgK/YiaL family protein [Elusimicrobiota bacterium]|jgi:YhcH/YjgK/YiaL family protein|nr:YhcH/YjgK/YiaL family protein [Elusimicrobiota bacterium]
MITGDLKNIDFYAGLFPKAKQGFEFLKKATAETENKRYEIEDGIFALVSDCIPKPIGERKLETHEEFIDIQFVAEGEDVIGFKPADECPEVLIPYNKEKDVAFFKGIADYGLPLKAGQFVMIFPDEAHAPASGDKKSKKVVVKVRLDLLK